MFKDHKASLEELYFEQKNLKEEQSFMKHRIDGLESNLPKIIREMIDYYTDQKVLPLLSVMAKKTDVKE